MTRRGVPSRPTDPTAKRGRRGAGADELLLLISSAEGVRVVRIGERRELVLGRAEDADVAIADDSVSRRHARLAIGERVTLEDLGSSNGSFYEDTRLPPHAPKGVVIGSAFELGSVTIILQRARGLAEPAAPRTVRPPDVIVHDEAMLRLYAMLDVIAPSPLSVLVLGETGTGKEVFAEELHRRSTRAAARFLQLHCAALPDTMIEGELFGYEKGAFTGATQAKPGLFEAADGGTVFLDEIGEVPLATQAKLLRVLESGEVVRLGSVEPRRVDVRFVAATNRDPRAMIADGTFRADLYFRINGIQLTLPPLRKRRADVVPLARHFLARMAAKLGRAVPSLSPGAIAALEAHPWPGNVRELRNAIERAVVIATDSRIDASHLWLDDAAPPAAPAAPSPSPGAGLGGELEALERARIEDALARCAGNQSQAAKLLGITRRVLVNRLDQYGIARPRKGRG